MEENCKNILIFFEKAVILLLRLCGHPVEILGLANNLNTGPEQD